MTQRENDHIEILTAAMRFKLAVNAHKGDIGDVAPEKLIELLRAEVDELEEAIKKGDRVAMMLESADCANFALAAVINATTRERNKKNTVLPNAVDGHSEKYDYHWAGDILTTYWKKGYNGALFRCNKDGSQ